ncbi:hypothetical protein AAMO2058_001540800 [Amorphochlora amoebiformis]
MSIRRTKNEVASKYLRDRVSGRSYGKDEDYLCQNKFGGILPSFIRIFAPVDMAAKKAIKVCSCFHWTVRFISCTVGVTLLA